MCNRPGMTVRARLNTNFLIKISQNLIATKDAAFPKLFRFLKICQLVPDFYWIVVKIAAYDPSVV